MTTSQFNSNKWGENKQIEREKLLERNVRVAEFRTNSHNHHFSAKMKLQKKGKVFFLQILQQGDIGCKTAVYPNKPEIMKFNKI